MKRILSIVAMMMLVPMVAFSMEAVSDSEMEAISGAGVDIAMDTGLTAAVSMQDVSWSNVGSVTMVGTITTDIVFAPLASVTLDVTAAGVEIGLNGLSVNVGIPDIEVQINSAAIGTLGGTIGVALTMPDTLTISAM